MRNITAFAVLVSIWLCSRPLPVHGAEFSSPSIPVREQGTQRTYGLSIAPQFGFVYGQAIELVYPDPQYHGKYLSELLWDMKPVWYYGCALDFGKTEPYVKPGFSSGFSLKFGIPGDSGSMEDRDWLSRTSARLTDYSHHTNTTNYLLFLDGTAGATIPAGKNFLVRLFAAVSYMRFEFTASDGCGIYSDETPDGIIKIDFDEEVMTYSQDWLIFAPGISLKQRFSQYFTADFSLKISPFVFCSDIDRHLRTGRMYKDFPRWGLFVEPKLELSFRAADSFDIGLDLAYRSIGGSRGDIYETAIDADAPYTFFRDLAGAGLSLLDAALLAKIRF
jgi:outer membrane protease